MFSDSSRARSPRIVPGAESSGLVAPIIVRTVATALGPLEGHGHERPGGDELDELAEERLALVLRVVALGHGLLEDELLEPPDPEAAPLEASEDLGHEAAAPRRRA